MLHKIDLIPPAYFDRLSMAIAQCQSELVEDSGKVRKRSLRIISYLIVFAAIFYMPAVSQVTDSAKTNIIAKKLNIPKQHSPRMAATMSAILPGSGQIYNKKYWKVPVIYACAVGLGYSFNFNQTKYIQYRNAYKVRLSNGPGTVGNYPYYSDSDLNTLQKYYHRYRDLTVIGATLLYFMNVIDASVDAHLFDFSVEDDDLSFNIHPTLINTAYINQYTTGLSFSIKF